MANAEEKDNFWVWIGGLIVVVIILVGMLKQDETKHLTGGAEELSAEVDAQIANRRKNIHVMENQ